MAQPAPAPDPGRGRPRHRGRFKRFLRGYLMTAGALATALALARLLVWLFVEIIKWTPGAPTP